MHNNATFITLTPSRLIIFALVIYETYEYTYEALLHTQCFIMTSWDVNLLPGGSCNLFAYSVHNSYVTILLGNRHLLDSSPFERDLHQNVPVREIAQPYKDTRRERRVLGRGEGERIAFSIDDR